MEDTTKGESPVEETPASEPQGTLDPDRASIYEKYDAMKAAEGAKEAEVPAAEERAPEEAPPEKASATEEKPKAEPAKEPVVEELTSEEFAERFKNVKVKGKFAGEEAVVDAKDLLRVQGLDRHLTKRLQEVARKEEALGAALPPPNDYRPPETPPASDKALRYWNENEIAAKYDEMFSESPYKANQFLENVKVERNRAQEETRKARMDTAERDYFAMHPESEAPIRDFFSDSKNFSDPRISSALERGDYYGVLEIANIRIEAKAVAAERNAIKAAREEAIAEEKKKADLKKKGSVIRTSSRPEVKPPEEFRELSPSETIAAEAARRRALMNR